MASRSAAGAPAAKVATVHWLNSELALAAANPETLAKAYRKGARAVVDLRPAADDIASSVRDAGMRYLRVSVADRQTLRPEELHIVTRWILERIAAKGAVLIHDEPGRGNDATVAAAALVRAGRNLDSALQLVQKARRETITDAQTELVARFARELRPVDA